MIDSHAHLTDPAFAGEVEAVLDRARRAGVHRFVTVGYDLASSRACADLARREADVVAAVGIHPHDADTVTSDSLRELRDLATDPAVVAVGEIGLDYYRLRHPREIQKKALEAQLQIADAVAKPVVIHDRDAHEDLLGMLLPWSAMRRTSGPDAPIGVLHCFSADLDAAERAIASGFLISFAGNVTYRGASQLADVARRIDRDSLLVETDCPYLSPMPFRGKRNEPANVVHTARFMADIRGEVLVELSSVTDANAARLFGV